MASVVEHLAVSPDRHGPGAVCDAPVRRIPRGPLDDRHRCVAAAEPAAGAAVPRLLAAAPGGVGRPPYLEGAAPTPGETIMMMTNDSREARFRLTGQLIAGMVLAAL